MYVNDLVNRIVEIEKEKDVPFYLTHAELVIKDSNGNYKIIKPENVSVKYMIPSPLYVEGTNQVSDDWEHSLEESNLEHCRYFIVLDI